MLFIASISASSTLRLKFVEDRKRVGKTKGSGERTGGGGEEEILSGRRRDVKTIMAEGR